MKTLAALATILVLAACGGRREKKQADFEYDEEMSEYDSEEVEEYEYVPSALEAMLDSPTHHTFGADDITLVYHTDSTFHTYIGHGMGEIGKTYSNLFRYSVHRNEEGEVSTEGDQIVVYLKYRNDIIIPFIANGLRDQLEGWLSSPNDLYRVEWRVDTMRRVGAPESLTLQYFATKATKEAQQGVDIAGIRWATLNVDAPGTFTANPADAGMHYQWNRKKGWPATGETVEDWDATTPEGGTHWARVNDPCPEGWKVPRQKQLFSLLDTARVARSFTWPEEYGVRGYEFTDKKTGNSIFLPLVRTRSVEGKLNEDTEMYGTGCGYWSSFREGEKNAYFLYFGTKSGIYDNSFYRSAGMSVRCVAD